MAYVATSTGARKKKRKNRPLKGLTKFLKSKGVKAITRVGKDTLKKVGLNMARNMADKAIAASLAY